MEMSVIIYVVWCVSLFKQKNWKVCKNSMWKEENLYLYYLYITFGKKRRRMLQLLITLIHQIYWRQKSYLSFILYTFTIWLQNFVKRQMFVKHFSYISMLLLKKIIFHWATAILICDSKMTLVVEGVHWRLISISLALDETLRLKWGRSNMWSVHLKWTLV